MALNGRSQTLGTEMARSGCGAADRYVSAPVAGGPAILVYYSPAFLRNLAPDTALIALRILASVYRHARLLWPARDEDEATTVTVYVDALKACADAEAVQAPFGRGGYWVLAQRNETEASVEQRELAALPASFGARVAEGAHDDAPHFEVLPLWELPAAPPSPPVSDPLYGQQPEGLRRRIV